MTILILLHKWFFELLMDSFYFLIDVESTQIYNVQKYINVFMGHFYLQITYDVF